MAERLETQGIADFTESLESLLEYPSPSTREAARELRVDASELRPKSAKEIGDECGVSDRVIQDNFKTVLKAYPWIALQDLKMGSSNKTRYTPLAQQLIAQFRQSELTPDDWIALNHRSHPEAYENWLQTQSIQPDSTTSEAPFPSESGNTSSESAMIPYQAASGEMERFTPPARKIFKYTSTQSFVQDATQQTEEGLETTQSNSSALTDALINQMTEEGRKLGVTLFQAKYGTAHAVLADLEEALAKKSGLVSDSASPPSGSAA